MAPALIITTDGDDKHSLFEVIIFAVYESINGILQVPARRKGNPRPASGLRELPTAREETVRSDGTCCVPLPFLHAPNVEQTLPVGRKGVVMLDQKRLIIGISGASGVMYGVRMLQLLRNAGVETHLVMSRTAEITLAYESDMKVADVKALASVCHAQDDMAAAISSGSFRTMGMVVAPCSMRSMSEIASGVTTGLLTRAADVVLKERRRLVLMARETPLHTGHLRTMTAVSEMGAIIAPPVPAFYAKPESVEDLIDHTVGRVLDLFDIELGVVRRWGEDTRLKRRAPPLRQIKA